MEHSATYSPEDNKLRLYPACRLDAEEYARVKAAGFKWAPRQELFVAPAWTPSREDLLLEMCGEIGDENQSLSDRAEQRAGRFEDYSDKRAQDAERARRAVSTIADNIPFGQPILVGHHSERRARRDAEKIENGMRKAVRMWETSEYWTRRAEAARDHAEYKELPSVRARRIRTIEADKRKMERNRAEHVHCLKFWEGKLNVTGPGGVKFQPLAITEEHREVIYKVLGNSSRLAYLPVCKSPHGSTYDAWDVLRPDGERYESCPAYSIAQVQEIALRHYPDMIAYCDRWLAHYENRLTYERTMLAEAGGTVADQKGPEKGGACKCWASHRGCWSYIQKVNKISVTVLDNWGNGGGNFTRNIPFDKLNAIMGAAEVTQARAAGRITETDDKTGFYLREVADHPAADPAPVTDPSPPAAAAAAEEPAKEEENPAAAFTAMKETLRAGGIKVVSAPQLFPTPADIAARVIELADIRPGHRVLEPSAGTGALLDLLPDVQAGGFVTAVEISRDLAQHLREKFPAVSVYCADFLDLNGELGRFDRIIMNPPFKDADDIRHINHARAKLTPGGRLVAICANGPRQQEKLKPEAAAWHPLPSGSFAAAGTGVNAALVVFAPSVFELLMNGTQSAPKITPR